MIAAPRGVSPAAIRVGRRKGVSENARADGQECVEFPIRQNEGHPAAYEIALRRRGSLSRFDRCSTASPMHRSTETVLERIGTERFQTKPSPTQSGRMRSWLLPQQHEDTSP